MIARDRGGRVVQEGADRPAARPQHAVGPRGRTPLLAGVVGVGADVELVRRLEVDLRLVEGLEGRRARLAAQLREELVRHQQRAPVAAPHAPSHLGVGQRQPIVEVAEQPARAVLEGRRQRRRRGGGEAGGERLEDLAHRGVAMLLLLGAAARRQMRRHKAQALAVQLEAQRDGALVAHDAAQPRLDRLGRHAAHVRRQLGTDKHAQQQTHQLQRRRLAAAAVVGTHRHVPDAVVQVGEVRADLPLEHLPLGAVLGQQQAVQLERHELLAAQADHVGRRARPLAGCHVVPNRHARAIGDRLLRRGARAAQLAAQLARRLVQREPARDVLVVARPAVEVPRAAEDP